MASLKSAKAVAEIEKELEKLKKTLTGAREKAVKEYEREVLQLKKKLNSEQHF